MKRVLNLFAATALLAGLAVGQKPAQLERQAAKKAEKQAEKQALRQDAQAQTILQRLVGMTPAQREKALSRLAPERRQQIETKLRNFDQLSPAAKAGLAERAQKLKAMPAQDQAEVRQALVRFNALPPARKKFVGQEVERVRQMNVEQREAYFASEQFRTRFPQPAGQAMVRNLIEVMPESQQ